MRYHTKLTEKEKNGLMQRYLAGEEVTKLCREKHISRVVFYRWYKRYLAHKKTVVASQKKLSPRIRLQMIERVLAGEDVASVCKLYHVSRTVFYKWFNRYKYAEDIEKNVALNNKIPEIDRYYKQAPEEYEEAVLDAVRKYPELSSHRLPYALPHIGNKPIVGNHGVQNILRRHDLQTYEKRLAYANSYQESFVFGPFVEKVQEFLYGLVSKTTVDRKSAIRFGLTAFFSFVFAIAAIGFFAFLRGSGSGVVTWTPLMIFPLGSLFVGILFFLYSIKYYFSIALVLSFSHREQESQNKGDSFWQKLFRDDKENVGQIKGGLLQDLSRVKLSRFPFVSIHLALFNEKRVVERLLTAATSMDYDNYEVIVADDSTDPEAIALLEKWKHNPKVKIVHRESRDGYKGQALQNALRYTNKHAEFIMIFDADFIPYPDSIKQFLKYFQETIGGLSGEKISKTNIAAVQGYQWHVLNKSENWITRGVRSEYSGSYVVERSSIELYGGLKQISGSVYMVRRDVVEKVGWGKSITEDFEFTLRLYDKGFKVVYTPYVQAPAEAVSTIKRLIRQRMRWAEGHSYNVKKMFWRLLGNRHLSFAEKFEFVYLSPYYLQAAFFLLGTFLWFLSEAVFQVRLPFWTQVWGWSLILTNMISLPLVNLVGLFLEESDERDYLGLLSFVALSYIVAPFQGYAAVRGFLEKEEGPWFRTPKTGKITDTFTPGHFYRYIKEFFGNKLPVSASSKVSLAPNPYIALATANNRFNQFAILRQSSKKVGNMVMSGFFIFMSLLIGFSPFVPVLQVSASSVGKIVTVDDIKKDQQVILPENITTPRTVRYTLPDGRVLEMIFHKEPRVRIKINDEELDITTTQVAGVAALPQASIIYGNTKVVYANIVPNIDLEYTVNANGFHEQFIIKKKMAITDVVQQVVPKNVNVVSPGEDTFGFFDKTTNKEAFSIGNPYLSEQSHTEKTSGGVKYLFNKSFVGYTLKKTITPEGQDWLNSPQRQYPVILDPTVVASGVVANDVKFGGNQRKITFTNNAWYVFREIGSTGTSDLGDIYYTKSTDGGQSWGSDVKMTDSGDTTCNGQRSQPSIWVSGTNIWVVWNTRNCTGTTEDDRVEFRELLTASADGLGTKCYSADGGTYSGANVNAIAVAGGTVYAMNANDPDLYKQTNQTTCTNGTNWTAITTSSGVSAASQPVFDSDGTNLYVLSQSTGIKFNRYTGSAWGTALTLSSSTSTNFSMLNDGTTIWELNGNAGTTTEFRKCTLSTTCLSAGNWSTQTAPWTSVTGIDSMSLTLDSTNSRIYAMIMYGGASNEQVYFKDTAKGTTSWGSEYNFGWSAADMSDVDSPYSSAGTTGIGVVARNGSNYEFATLPEELYILLSAVPFVPKLLKRLRERKIVWSVS